MAITETAKITTSGIPTTPSTNGAVPLRYEIRDFLKKFPDQWDLYLLALAEFQRTPAYDNDKKAVRESYFQIAGIHGLPYVPYDGAVGTTKTDGFGGYCTHSSALFASWHRPFLALFEQTLYKKMLVVIASLPTALQSRYTAAAKNFRIPYYDFVVGSPNDEFVPSLIRLPLPTLNNPALAKYLEQVDTQPRNPLYDFKFSTLQNTLRGRTTREPRSYADIKSDSTNLKSQIFNIMNFYTDFDAFSHDSWGTNQSTTRTYGSLEQVHNTIHSDFGGSMGSFDTSAFDPVFWLHHCNIDRLCAIWQGLHPKSYIGATSTNSAGIPNFFLTSTSTVNVKTGLAPFRGSTGDYLNSGDVQYTTAFSYAYPETQSWNYAKVADYQTALGTTIQQMYGNLSKVKSFLGSRRAISHVSDDTAALSAAPDAEILEEQAAPPAVEAEVQTPLTTQEVPQEVAPEPVPVEQADPPAVEAEEPETLSTEEVAPAPAPVQQEEPKAAPETEDNLVYTDWIVNLRAQKHGLPHPFTVYVFLGDFPSDPSTWSTAPNMVGNFSALGRGATTGCDKCQGDRADDLIITAAVPLTEALMDDVVEEKVASLDSKDVEPYLEKNLHWRVQVLNGPEILREHVPGLMVIVSSNQVKITDDDIPVYVGHETLHPSITDQRPGGFSHGDAV